MVIILKVNPAPKFLIDGMLGTLAVKLRIFGFDTLYDKSSDDSQLLSHALRERRHLVTSDVELFLRTRRRISDASAKSILITSTSDTGRMIELFAKLGIEGIPESFVSRCSACNGTLHPLLDRMTREGVKIYGCSSCGKEYWKGGHWRKLDKFIRDVNAALRTRRTQCKPQMMPTRKSGNT